MSYGKSRDCPVCGTALVVSDIAGRYVECRSCHSVHDVTEMAP